MYLTYIIDTQLTSKMNSVLRLVVVDIFQLKVSYDMSQFFAKSFMASDQGVSLKPIRRNGVLIYSLFWYIPCFVAEYRTNAIRDLRLKDVNNNQANYIVRRCITKIFEN